MTEERQAAVRTAAAELPEKIKIGAFDYNIKVIGHLESSSRKSWGECDHFEMFIRVTAVMPCPLKFADTLLHEVLHAVFYTYGIEDGDKEERIVGVLSTAMISVYRDNPWFLAWLAKWTAR